MRILTFGLALCLGLALFAGEAAADPIAFRHEAWGPFTGTLNGDAFRASHFVIDAVGDTTNRVSVGSGVFFIDHDSARITIDGVGVVSFVTGTRTFMNNAVVIPGFSRAGSGGDDLFNGPEDIMPYWDMLSSTGPYGGSGYVLQWDYGDINTSGGILNMSTQGNLEVTFQAWVRESAPEPGSLALAATGLAVLIRRRRRKQTARA